MDLAIIAGVMYVAYNFSSTSDRSNVVITNKVPEKEKFSGKSIYESTRFDQVNTEIKKRADKAFRDANDPKSFTIPPFYNSLSLCTMSHELIICSMLLNSISFSVKSDLSNMPPLYALYSYS